MPVRIQKEIGIDMGHRVPTHKGKCRHLHGHRYRIIAEVSVPGVVPDDSGLSDAGMVMDFGVIKEILTKYIHDPYDHKLCLWDQDPLLQHTFPDGYYIPVFTKSLMLADIDSGVIRVPCIPTAENLARLWYETVEKEFRRRGLQVSLDAIIVYETPTSMAEYRPNVA